MNITDNTLWLARCVWTETKVVKEMAYIAWVIRNRVDGGYRGDTYKRVVLAPYQFSAFNPGYKWRTVNMNRGVDYKHPKWQECLTICNNVIESHIEDSIFYPYTQSPLNIFHYFSPRSMVRSKYTIEVDSGDNYGYRIAPSWADGAEEVIVPITGPRFRFYANVA